MYSTAEAHELIKAETRERQIALEYIAEAWNVAEADGIEPETLAHASIFAALATLVRAYGEETTSRLIAELPKRIAAGEYSLDRSIQ